MLDKMTDSMKFFITMIIYLMYLTWWASELNTTVTQQTVVSQKTVELLEEHIKECKGKDAELIILKADVKHLRYDVNILMDERNFRIGK